MLERNEFLKFSFSIIRLYLINPAIRLAYFCIKSRTRNYIITDYLIIWFTSERFIKLTELVISQCNMYGMFVELMESPRAHIEMRDLNRRTIGRLKRSSWSGHTVPAWSTSAESFFFDPYKARSGRTCSSDSQSDQHSYEDRSVLINVNFPPIFRYDALKHIDVKLKIFRSPRMSGATRKSRGEI